MARRHQLVPGSWQSVLGRLEELVLANSGEDEFQEIFKLILAKIFAERTPAAGPRFAVAASPAATADAVGELLAAADRRWPGICGGSPVMRLRPEHLCVCVAAIAGLHLADASLEVLDPLFEHLIGRASKGAKGQFFTPRHVIECCVRIVDPMPGESVLDPACGSAGFLIHALGHVRGAAPAADLAGYAAHDLWGADFDARAIQVARAMMLVAGDGESNLFRLNSLLAPDAPGAPGVPAAPGRREPVIEQVAADRLAAAGGFDVIMTNPPFAGDVREPGLLGRYELAGRGGRTERDVLFLERCVGLLRPGGRMAIVLPHGKFGAPGLAHLRAWLVRQVQVVAVLGLGRYTFLPHTSQKAAVLFARKRITPDPCPPAEPVLFLISERDGKDSAGRLVNRADAAAGEPAWLRVDHDLGDVVDIFGRFVAEHGIEWHRHG